MQEPCLYDFIKDPGHVESQRRSHIISVLPCCIDELDKEVKDSVYLPAQVGPHVLGWEKAVLL
jgi:hypothetical protein